MAKGATGADVAAVTSRGFEFSVIDALSGRVPVMLINAVNGGYLRPDAWDNPGDHGGEARTSVDSLETGDGIKLKEAGGHL